jgi:hypothetical protein
MVPPNSYSFTLFIHFPHPQACTAPMRNMWVDYYDTNWEMTKNGSHFEVLCEMAELGPNNWGLMFQPRGPVTQVGPIH